jgi:hypothetical protein
VRDQKKMKMFQNSREVASSGPTSPAKYPPAAIRCRAGSLPPSRQETSKCVSFQPLASKTTDVSDRRLAIKNTLQLTENKQQRPISNRR